MRKILVIAKRLIPPTGGAEFSLLSLLERLKKFKIYVICYGEEKKTFKYKDIVVTHLNYKTESRHSPFLTLFNSIRWLLSLVSKTKVIKPDVIITQVAYVPYGVMVAKLFKIPVIVFVASYEHFCLIDFIKGINCDRKCYKCLKGSRKVLFLLYFMKLLWHRLSLKLANVVIAPSNFIKQVCYKWYKITCKVIYPVVEFEKYFVENRNPQYITFASTRKEKIKGYHIFLEITKRLPQFKFMLVGARIEDLPENVKYVGFLKDMRDAFKHTKILLFPSLWPEPFGKVAVEAMVNGIPVIYSDSPGIREAVNGAGIPIKQPNNINEWIEKIKMLMEDPSLYKELSKKATIVATKFNANIAYREFVKILYAVL